MPLGMGFGELVLILIVLLVIVGGTKLPQLGDGLGKAIKNFKRASGAPGTIDVTPARAGVTGSGDGKDAAGKAPVHEGAGASPGPSPASSGSAAKTR